jgi:CheY-like chemotaxis protein
MDYRILLIEDDVELRLMLSMFLSKENKVIDINRSEDILKEIEIINPDLIITDIMLPGIDGVEILKTLKKSKYAHVPVIMITSIADYNNSRMCIEIGAIDYIYKPFKTAHLLKVINRQKEIKKINTAIGNLNKTNNLILGHEFRTPLHGIFNSLYLIKESGLLENNIELLSLFDLLSISIKRLNKNYFKLLLFFDDFNNQKKLGESLESYIGVIDKNFESNINRFVYELSTSLNWSGNAIIKIQIPDSIVIPNIFYLCIYEIIENAIKFSSFNSDITCNFLYNNSFVNVEISNSGTRIKSSVLNSYNPFTQFDREYFEQQGLGVGISLVKKSLLILKSGKLIFFDNKPSGIKCQMKFNYEKSKYLFN